MENRNFRYFDMILGLFVAVLLISSVLSVKAVKIPLPFFGWSFSFDGGTILFPISYIFSDVLTEVYGYERSRRVIWTGFASLLLLSFTTWLVGVLPADPLWKQQTAYQNLLMTSSRIALASIFGYFFGEFSNSFVLSKLKIATEGKYLWVRTIGSTLVGELLDSLVFVYAAFWGVWDQKLIFSVFISNYLFKTSYEIIATPFTYLVTGWLKKAEQENHFDYHANYNPFVLR